MSPSSDPRRLALDVLLRVAAGAYADLTLDAALAKHPTLDPRDRGLATELVYGTLRRQGRLDFALGRLCQQPFAKIETPLAWILRLAAYQILELDRVPDSAAVDTAVELTRQIGRERATGFVNGILRSLVRGKGEIPWPDPQRDPLAALQSWLGVPEWLARRWLRDWGVTEALALGQAALEPAPFTLRVNTLRCDRETLLSAFAAAGHVVEPCRYAPEGVVLRERGPAPLPGRDEGWFLPQDEASQLIAHLLAPQAGDRILDACSAPGGKTTHLAALTNNRARILALDLHPQRLRLVEHGARRLGCSGIETRPWDLTRPPAFLAPESFDRILLDAPCSGLGVLRRNPESSRRRSEADIAELAARQQTLLRHVAPLLRPGGTLLYSVCTNTPEETSQVIDGFLQANPDFARVDLRERFPQWGGLCDDSGALRTTPHRHDAMDAFFAVRLQRQGTSG